MQKQRIEWKRERMMSPGVGAQGMGVALLKGMDYIFYVKDVMRREAYGKVSKPGGYSMPRKVEKPYNGGQWTEARKKSFIISALRKARWPVKYQVLKDAYVIDGINPKTGRKCKLYRCAMCRGLFVQKEMAVDHILPIVDPEVGFVDWNNQKT